MRKIYNSKLDVAWIGDSAPVPNGWALDANEFKEAAAPVQDVDDGVPDTVELDIENMSKNELEAYARRAYGVELDKRKKLETLQLEVLDLMTGE